MNNVGDWIQEVSTVFFDFESRIGDRDRSELIDLLEDLTKPGNSVEETTSQCYDFWLINLRNPPSKRMLAYRLENVAGNYSGGEDLTGTANLLSGRAIAGIPFFKEFDKFRDLMTCAIEEVPLYMGNWNEISIFRLERGEWT